VGAVFRDEAAIGQSQLQEIAMETSVVDHNAVIGHAATLATMPDLLYGGAVAVAVEAEIA